MARILSEQWSPPWASHVVGRYEAECVDADGRRETQHLVIACSVCGEEFAKGCDSGRVRQHIASFASIHIHRNPLEAIPKTRGGVR